MVAFIVLVAGAIAAATAYVAWAALQLEPNRRAYAAARRGAAARDRREAVPRLPARRARRALRRDRRSRPSMRRAPKPTFTGPRVRARVLCRRARTLPDDRGSRLARDVHDARVFGTDFQPASRRRASTGSAAARASRRSGRYGAATTFVTGHSYLDDGFSTLTALIDMSSGEVLANLEKFEVTRDGEALQEHRLQLLGRHVRARRAALLRHALDGREVLPRRGRRPDAAAPASIARGVECPSLSPDETRIAFKRRQGERLAPARPRPGDWARDPARRDAQRRRPGRVARRRPDPLRPDQGRLGRPRRRTREATDLHSGRAFPGRRPFLAREVATID